MRDPAPTPAQLDAMRVSAHKAIDRAVVAWPTIFRRAHEMAPGVRSPTGGGHGVGGHSDPTANLACGPPELDAAAPYAEWLAAFAETMAHIFVCDDGAARLGASQRAERPNRIEVCAECGMPAPKVRRIDGAPFCSTTCYHRVLRAKTREREL